MTAHLRIQQAIVAALQAAPAVAGGNVRANTVRPVSAAFSQAVVVRLVRSTAPRPQMLGAPSAWSTVIQIDCMARASTAGADPVAVVDELVEAVWSRVRALELRDLGVVDLRMEQQIDWDAEDADVPIAIARLSVVVNHRTTTDTLSVTT